MAKITKFLARVSKIQLNDINKSLTTSERTFFFVLIFSFALVDPLSRFRGWKFPTVDTQVVAILNDFAERLKNPVAFWSYLQPCSQKQNHRKHTTLFYWQHAVNVRFNRTKDIRTRDLSYTQNIRILQRDVLWTGELQEYLIGVTTDGRMVVERGRRPANFVWETSSESSGQRKRESKFPG